MVPTKEKKSVINNWNFGNILGEIIQPIVFKILIKWFIVLLIVVNVLSVFTSISLENHAVYDKCIDTCSQDYDEIEVHYTLRGSAPASFSPDLHYGRGFCVEQCNEMYLILRGFE